MNISESNKTLLGMTSPRNVLSAEEVGVRLRISTATVHHLTRLGQIKAVKMGRQWQYDEADVENYLSGIGETAQHRNREPEMERRKEHRRSCFVQGRVIIGVSENKRWVGDGAILNMSAHGVLFEVSNLVETEGEVIQNMPVLLSLYLPGLFSELELKGCIRHMQEDEKIRFGLCFENMNPKAEDVITGYIA